MAVIPIDDNIVLKGDMQGAPLDYGGDTGEAYIFYGTLAQWNLLSTAEQDYYDYVFTPEQE